MLAVIGVPPINFLTSTKRAYPDNELTTDVIYNIIIQNRKLKLHLERTKNISLRTSYI